MSKKYIILTAILLVVVSAFFVIAARNFIYIPINDASQEIIEFSIEKGQGVEDIAGNLKTEGLIKSKNAFILYAFLSGKASQLQSGNYALSGAMNATDLLNKFSSGDVIKETITLIEGWNLNDIAWFLEGRGMFQAEELFELVGFPLVDYSVVAELPKPIDFSQRFNFLADKPKNISLEGYFYPDTYELTRGEALRSIVEKALSNFDKKLTTSLRDEIKKQGKSIFEIVTMASLIEKEARLPEDKKIVSGILWKRLSIGMPLQVDATVNYVTGRRDTGVLISETQIDSDYNTYRNRGLPLGPIANPGIESIEAAIYPQNSPYLYYLSTKEGEIIFSRTLEEHNLAKNKYLK